MSSSVDEVDKVRAARASHGSGIIRSILCAASTRHVPCLAAAAAAIKLCFTLRQVMGAWTITPLRRWPPDARPPPRPAMSPAVPPQHVLRKYEVTQKLGKGAYAVVFKAVEKKTKETVALKKIFDAFQNQTDAQRTFREIMYLQALARRQRTHPNIIRLRNLLKAENDKDIYLVFDFMETDLHAVIRANILEPVHKQFIVYQTLKALKYCHSAGLLHRDLKPSNLLLNEECILKVADFGLARTVKDAKDAAETNTVLTDYVATRWYRAPEIMLGSTSYTKAVDTWALGCIIAEMFIGKPILPGTSTVDQLTRILEITGKPDGAAIAAMDSAFAERMIGEDAKKRARRTTSRRCRPRAASTVSSSSSGSWRASRRRSTITWWGWCAT